MWFGGTADRVRLLVNSKSKEVVAAKMIDMSTYKDNAKAIQKEVHLLLYFYSRNKKEGTNGNKAFDSICRFK